MMRICLILTSFTSGGAEMLVASLARQYAAQDHRVEVLALSDAARVGNDTGIERRMIEQLRDAGIDARSLGLRHRRNPLAGARKLRGALSEAMPDIIHAHTANALPMIALARPGAPVILTHHNSRLSFPPQAYRLFDHIVAGYVAISDECAQRTARYARRPIRRILNAASPHFQAAAPRRAPARDPVILAVGTVSTQKDYPTLIRAARPLAERLAAMGRRPHIRIAGGGAMLAELASLVESEKVGDVVGLLGVRSDVADLMRDADLFANSSLWEGYSIAMIEAAMSGLPIVATEVAGNSEMVIPGANGALVRGSDPQALADAMADIVSDDGRYAALSQGALDSARRFSIQTCAADHLALYRDAQRGAVAAPVAAVAW